jgi:hypothetical protein
MAANIKDRRGTKSMRDRQQHQTSLQRPIQRHELTRGSLSLRKECTCQQTKEIIIHAQGSNHDQSHITYQH